MYLGVFVMIYGWRMTNKFPKLDEIFDRVTIVDHEISKLLGSNEKIRKSERTQFQFESTCMVAITVAYIIISVYDIWFMYPP